MKDIVEDSVEAAGAAEVEGESGRGGIRSGDKWNVHPARIRIRLEYIKPRTT